MALEQKITLEVNDAEFVFNVNAAAYNKFLNTSSQGVKIQGATNFLMDVVDDTNRKDLKDLLKKPGAAHNVVGAVVEQYQPEFNITVKK